eukprot:CCRYP_001743-RA/>CCRYP_001743-RA protein AED:0.39 eAED:0.37 QI:0/0.5/0/1/1/1/5/0/703
MISSSSITAYRQRRRSTGHRISPIPKESRQIEPIEKDNENESSGDVETPTCNDSSHSRRPAEVMKPTRRRMSSKFRTRETIVRLLHENEVTPGVTVGDTSDDASKQTYHRRESLFSPVDWWMSPSSENQMPPSEDIHREWEKRKLLLVERPPPKYIMLPQNKFRLAWDVIMAFLLCVMAFYVPYRVCFFWEDDDEGDETSPVFIFETIVAYTNPSTSLVVSSPKLIALNYIKTYFFIDLMATIPLGYILTHSPLAIASKLGKLGRLPKLVKFVRAARLLKLLRVYKLQKFILKLEAHYNVHHGISRLIKIVIAIMIVTHMVGCFWYLIGLSGDDDILNGGWVYRYGVILNPKPVQYIASMYWAFSTLTTVGYGDISARTPQEQVYAMVMMLVGVSWYAYIVSSMSTIMSSFDAQNKAVRDKMLCVNEFIRAAKLPKELSKQVRDFFDFKLAKSQHAFLMSTNYDVDELLDELGSGLRADVLLYMDRHLISKIPFLQNKVPQFVADMISMFQPMVFHEGDYICKEGTQADEMFFLVKGKAGIYYGPKLIVVIEEGSYFGEIGCIMGGIRRAGVKALTTCELQALSRRNLNILLAEYPDVGDELKRVARDRAKIAKTGVQAESANGDESSTRENLNGSERCSPEMSDPSANVGPHISTSPATDKHARYLSLVEAEVNRIVNTISIKIRSDMGLSVPATEIHDGIT